MNEEQKQQLTEVELDEVVGGTEEDNDYGLDLEGGHTTLKKF